MTHTRNLDPLYAAGLRPRSHLCQATAQPLSHVGANTLMITRTDSVKLTHIPCPPHCRYALPHTVKTHNLTQPTQARNNHHAPAVLSRHAPVHHLNAPVPPHVHTLQTPVSLCGLFLVVGLVDTWDWNQVPSRHYHSPQPYPVPPLPYTSTTTPAATRLIRSSGHHARPFFCFHSIILDRRLWLGISAFPPGIFWLVSGLTALRASQSVMAARSYV